MPGKWRWGKGTASEHDHLRRLLPTLPERALLVADAAFLGYDLFCSILQAPASFLVRMSSRAYLYTLEEKPLRRNSSRSSLDTSCVRVQQRWASASD